MSLPIEEEEGLKGNLEDHPEEVSLISLLKPMTSKISVRILEQILLLSVLIGRWLLPRDGMSRDQLSQLLLINIGTAADILEVFEAFKEQIVTQSPSLKIIIMCVWQASLFQFCFNKTATLQRKQPQNLENSAEFVTEVAQTTKCRYCVCLCCPRRRAPLQRFRSTIPCASRPCLCCETELWAIGLSLMLQDVPFLVLRMTLITKFKVMSYTNIFFTCKNTLFILLQVFRSSVIIFSAMPDKKLPTRTTFLNTTNDPK